ncbi:MULTISPECIES: peptidoglycan editing factor PgeF [Bacillus]|uniref:Purine nucleoside phosphorylase n=1 Tax=Bacillus infantis TaxID=324767 RepID=A0A5D4SLL1_9BACI|nr:MULTISPECIES: peptidoglycan editing factor PgeF [Bacillus]MCK6203877.1 peptidoglycan editing factor PgeF [Bacillus infantis]OXT18737.1 laccase [Bacillus sp. OG2]TYS63078.1 peptidoglycan editing factor PgeF [Bacillus infantis]
MEPFVLKESKFFSIEDWTEKFPGLAAGFSTKNGGNSNGDYSSLNLGLHVNDSVQAVCGNREIFSESIGFPLPAWTGAEQTHETFIRKVSKEDAGTGALDYGQAFRRTDGFFTLEQGLLLTLCFADCVPLYFTHPDSGAIGAAHAGWKGTVGGIAGNMAGVFKNEGIDPGEILAAIGPSICEKCYIVDSRVVNLVKNRLEDVDKKPYNQVKENQYQLDLKEVNKQLLMKSGIREENIIVSGYCTSCHEEYFFSHRRDGGKTGRMMSYIGWKEADCS